MIGNKWLVQICLLMRYSNVGRLRAPYSSIPLLALHGRFNGEQALRTQDGFHFSDLRVRWYLYIKLYNK